MVDEMELDSSLSQQTSSSSETIEVAKSQIVFSLKRKEEKKLITAAVEVTSVHLDDDEKSELEEQARAAKRRKLERIEGGNIPKDEDEVKKKLFIPMVVESDWRVAKLLKLKEDGTMTEKDEAVLRLLTENQPSDRKKGENLSISVEPDGEKKEAADADYEAMPIDGFGLAMLRGCGWKDGEGIGRNPKVVALHLPARRPKGLGLGAAPKAPVASARPGSSKDDEELRGEIRKESLIKVDDGKHKYYGKVSSRDDDNNSVFVQKALGRNTVRVNLAYVVKVTRKEYDERSRCINQEDYDRERDIIEKRNEASVKSDRRSRNDESRKHKRDDYSSRYEIKEVDERELWARQDLVVRFINKNEKPSLYKVKMRVVDVASRSNVTLEDDRGKLYYNLHQNWMETVIPREPGEKLMVVRGKHAGKTALMEAKDKERERVVARILTTNQVLDLDFEEVCLIRPKYDDCDYED